ncbi:hypothetical protein QNH14_21185 [Apirhabdus apintestini]|nr:hypothetical protein QNH14_21185 [Enterobacteriaceae bacterium CA-0114]
MKSASLKASGTDSTLIRTTGTGSSMHTGALTLNVAGSGATGVRVEGGATGTIDAATQIDISGNGATAGIVDGRYFKADGTEDTGKKGESGLLSEATLTTANTSSQCAGL